MDAILMDVNWLAVIVGAVVAWVFGGLWYSPKMFQKKWLEGVKIPANNKDSSMPGMIAQGFGTFLFAWVIGVTETTGNIFLAILITLTIAVLIKANGFFSQKSMYAIKVETSYILVMAIIMVIAQAIF